MIEKVTLCNFKCFENISIEMSNLNVLTGINSMGKSTIIQAILLLRQSFELGSLEKGLHLDGEIVNIGTGYDLLYRDSDKDQFEIDIQVDGKNNIFKYEYNKDSDYQKLTNESKSESEINTINIFKPSFAYVSAERIGPQRIYNKSYHEIMDNNQVGYKGELFADYLAERGNIDKVENEYIISPKERSTFLLYQTQAWLSEISPGVKIDTKPFREVGLVGVEYGVATQGELGTFNPLNVGFGLSYVVPIIISLLKAKKGDLVILENPEAHLHPRGQRKMGELISKACAGGVQVIVETHSDHLLNGIRLSVKNRIINRNLVRLNYFYIIENDKRVMHDKCSPAILEDGSLSDWPEGFFDEWEKAIDELF